MSSSHTVNSENEPFLTPSSCTSNLVRVDLKLPDDGTEISKSQGRDWLFESRLWNLLSTWLKNLPSGQLPPVLWRSLVDLLSQKNIYVYTSNLLSKRPKVQRFKSSTSTSGNRKVSSIRDASSATTHPASLVQALALRVERLLVSILLRNRYVAMVNHKYPSVLIKYLEAY